MLQPVNNPYPGESASAEQLLQLADEYRTAAHTLLEQGKAGQPLSWAPCRLSAIHAIELYFNALLLNKGMKPAQIRNLRHCLSQRAELAPVNGLQLRKKTSDHLIEMARNRELLVTRYGAEMPASVSEINRLTATLEEVGDKVSEILSA